jgi:hypothetical protein
MEGKDYGLKMTIQSKNVGNSYLKTYIEDGNFELFDFETICQMIY